MKELEDMLIRHIEKSDKFQEQAIEKLSAIETHNTYTKETLEEHKGHIDDYRKHKGILYGAIISLSAVWGFFELIWHKLFK